MQFAENIKNGDLARVFEDGTKLTAEGKFELWSQIHLYPNAPSRQILEEASQPRITIRHLNRLRNSWGISRTKGRPKKPMAEQSSSDVPVPIKLNANLSFIGVHIFACWVEMQGLFPTVLELLKEAILLHMVNHPQDSFPLLNHQDETLLARFRALFFAPLFGVQKLIEYDVREHALETVIGRSYQSSTLNQFLGQLERIDAAPVLKNALISADENTGNICFIDGHMIPFWSRLSMHKGKITMLGRIMAGSQAIVAHIETGHAVYFDYQPPDTRLPKMIIEFCAQIVTLTGIEIFVIDREVNSEAIAREFAEHGWGLLCMLDKSEYKDLSDWETEYIGKLTDGAEVYQGHWKPEKKKNDDTRHFVIVVRDGRILPYWGTPALAKKVAYLEWPGLYSQRTENQENNFRRMKEHGALDVNYGTKKIECVDRHHQRKVDEKQEQLQKAERKASGKEEKIKEQEKKVEESKEKDHGTRLDQRNNRLAVLKAEHAKIETQKEAIKEGIEKLGPPGTRYDRDFRKQSIMTLRTLLLENKLIEFFSLILVLMSGDVSMNLDSFIRLFFERSGGFYESPLEEVYLVNTKGLSKTNIVTMHKLIGAVNKMGLYRNGKPVRLHVRGYPSP